MSHRTRRQFLEDSMLASVAAVAASGSSSLLAADASKQSTSPGEKLSVAIVGAGGRGGSHIGAFSGRKDTEITYIVDADEKKGNAACESIEKKTGRKPKYVKDMREAFDDKNLDLVSTATPNHWHALVSIWAMQAGKDVYVEKPVSHNVSEGRRIVEVAKKYNKICQCGTQSRSNPGMQNAIKYVQDEKLGKCKVARGLCYKPRGSIGPKGNYEIPAGVDYNLWCGPAPMDPLTRQKLHYDWHWVWSTGNGDLGNQGIHQMDLARWGLNVNQLSNAVISYGGRLGYEDAGETANTQVIVHDYGDKTLVFEVRGLKTEGLKNAKVGIIFECENGYLVMGSYAAGQAFDKNGQVIETFKGDGDHFGNFVDAVRSRKESDLNGHILEGHLSSALCHLGNISYRMGQKVGLSEAQERLKAIKTNENAQATFDRTREHLLANGVDLGKVDLQFGSWLAFDPKSEKFVNNSAADEHLTRPYRAPFIVPTADKI